MSELKLITKIPLSDPDPLNRGLFSFILQHISNCRELYGIDFISNFDLRNKTAYFDDKMSNENTWEYFFDVDTDLSISENTIYEYWIGKFNFYGYEFDYNDIEERIIGKNIIDKHIRFNSDILKSVNYFFEKNMKNNRILGVHKRGTDISEHYPKIDIDRYIYEIDSIISEYDYILLCTDEELVVDIFKSKYNNIITFESKTLSNNSDIPSFKYRKDGYLMGFEVIVESLLLSKVDFLLKTNSNVSNFSLLYNPSLKYKNII
jgi:hypothetical protein